MKIQHKSKRNKLHIIALYGFIAIAFIGLSLFTLEKLKITDFIKLPTNSSILNNNADINQNIDYSEPTQEQKDAGNVQKNNSDEIQESKVISATISSLTSDNNQVRIKSVISGVVTNSGTCKLTLTKSTGESVEKTANTYALPSTSTCMGFDINRSELSNGNWTATLIVTINNENTTATKEFTLE